MQGSQEGKRAKLWGPRAHLGANISMKIEERTFGTPCKEKKLQNRVKYYLVAAKVFSQP